MASFSQAERVIYLGNFQCWFLELYGTHSRIRRECRFLAYTISSHKSNCRNKDWSHSMTPRSVFQPSTTKRLGGCSCRSLSISSIEESSRRKVQGRTMAIRDHRELRTRRRSGRMLVSGSPSRSEKSRIRGDRNWLSVASRGIVGDTRGILESR